MMSEEIDLREASTLDSQEIAVLFEETRRINLPYLPELHNAQEDLEYFSKTVENENVIVAQSGDKVVGFCSYKDNWLNHLYVSPEYQGKGVGTALLNDAKTHNSELRLWVFQKNTKAIDFYKRNGFELLLTTDGLGNEEHEPDAQYVWYQANS